MTLFEAQAAAPILTHVFGDAEVRPEGWAGREYFVRIYSQPWVTIDVPTADEAGRLIAERIKGA